MSSIKVSWRGIQSAADECDSHRQELADHISSLRGIKSCRAMSGGEFSAIYKVLDKVIDGLEDEKRSLKSLSDGLTAVKKEYTEFENKIAGNIRSVSAEDVEAEEHSFEFPWSDLWSMISEGGIVGSGIAAAANMVTEEWSIGSIIDTAGYGISAIGDAAEAAANGTETDWAEALFGLDDVFKEMDFTDLTGAQRAGKAFKQSLINGWDDLIPDMKLFDSGAKFTERLSSFAKWAGPILTVGSSLVENIEEFKGQDGKTGRIIAETAVESAVDIGLGIAATVGVTTAAAALGITAAPAVAIGAAAVGVTWAANSVCEWITGGKDIGEVAADAVCNAGEAIVDAASDLGSSIKSGWDSFTQWAFG